MSKRILAVVDDLFFVVKIGDAAKRAGFEVKFMKDETEVVDSAAAEPPRMVIVDLNANSVKPVELIQRLKTHKGLKGLTIISYVSHVQGELKQRAQDAGASMVLARSAFSLNLPQILKRHSSAL
jgi:PleD family two-component response regulator